LKERCSGEVVIEALYWPDTIVPLVVLTIGVVWSIWASR
jgi:hypothetical protein